MTVKESVLQALEKNKEEFLSGEELSERLKVSRTAVWKAIKALREEGYPIEAVTNKGYLLMEDRWRITEESLRIHLPARYKNNHIHIYDTLDSTNLQGKRLALEKADHGTVIIARQQTAGRGRLGRSFFSPREGLYMSLIVKPDFDLSRSVLVTSAAAVAVAESLEKVCGADAKIKWVNDVFVDGKKVCGILTEGINDFETGQIETLVIGMGINTTLKDFPEELLEVAGAVEGAYSKSELAAEIMSRLLDLTERIEERTFMDAYRERSLLLGKTIKVYKGAYKVDLEKEGIGVPARALDIDDDGGLCVLYADGTREVLTTGEVSVKL
ncbi:MAG: biotin--[acetyl-CoA-carboxylase] ligase [Bacillota bacterium]|nr:biotin--[acetyl-CoA-carboxylase] ligase [Bacillota bacterium]